jgi:predicted outer membrane protein
MFNSYSTARLLFILPIALTAAIAFAPRIYGEDAKRPAAMIFSTDLGGNDLQFLKLAAAQGVMQSNLGELVAGHAQSSEVRALAQTLARQIGSQNEAVRLAAIRKGLTVPSAPNPRQKATLDKLAALEGLKFDKASTLEMVQEQQDYADLIGKATQSNDADIQTLATSLFPEVKEQLLLLRKITGTAPATGTATNSRTE